MTKPVEPFKVHGLNIRLATKADIPALVALHRRNFSPDEFSMMLSAAPTEIFYQACVDDPMVSLLVGEDEEIFCFSVVFARYQKFYQRYRNCNLWLFAKELLGMIARMDVKCIKQFLIYVLEKSVVPISEDVKDAHVGSLALDKKVRGRPEYIMCFHRLFTTNVNWLRKTAEFGYWTTVFEDNKASRRMINSVLKPDSFFLYRRNPKNTLCFIKRF